MTTDRNLNPLDRFFSGGIRLNWETAVIIILLLLAIFTRFYMLGERVMSHDESLHTRFSYNLYNEGDFSHTPLMHGPILFHAAAFSYALFGDSDFSARIYTSLLGVLLVMSPLLFRRWLGRWGTILAITMLLISPLILYYNRYIRHDTPSMLFAVVMMWATLMYINGPENQRRRAHWLYVIAAMMILNLGSKETAFIYIAIFGIFLAIYFFVRLAQYFLKIPGKPVFYFIMIGIFFGGVLSLGMYIVLDIIQFDLFPEVPEAAFGALPVGDQTTYFVWTALVILVVLAVMMGTLLWAFREKGPRAVPWAQVAAMLGIAFFTSFGLVVIEELSHTQPSQEEGQPAEPVVPGEAAADTVMIEPQIRWTPMIAVWVVGVGGLIFLVLVRRRRSDDDDDDDDLPDKDKRGLGFWGTLDLFPEADVMIVIGTLILPWATALVPYFMRGTSTDFMNIAGTLPPFINNMLMGVPQVTTAADVGRVWVHILAWLPLMSLSFAIGLAWNWRRWLIAAAIFYVIFAFFFTTVFTNIAGLASGMIYSLGYWLEQQGVRRGSQPQYYYLLIIMPFYEFLPVIGSVLAMFAGSVMFWRWRGQQDERRRQIRQLGLLDDIDDDTPDETLTPAEREARALSRRVSLPRLVQRENEEERLERIPFLLFWSWLAILNLVGYSLAGEKMPWLGTHLTLPLIFLAAWYFGRIIEKIDWATFKKSGWVLLLILPLLTVTLIQVILPLLIGRGPFQGLSQAQLQQTYSWLAAVAISGGVAFVVIRLAQTVSWLHVRRLLAVTVFILLAGITFRSAWMASFINYDLPTEYLVYAHAAPAIKDVLEDIEELSLRTTDGMEIQMAYDNSVSWPYSWYFRDFDNALFIGENPTVQNLEDKVVVVVGDDKRGRVEPILEDRYYRYDHMRLWWPMQDYFYLTPQRVQNTFDFSPDNTQAAQIREGLFHIWWSRDYSVYGNALEKDFSLPRWPVSDRMHVYIRKDYASQIWEYGTGEGTVANPLEALEQNACSANWIPEREVLTVLTPPDMPMNRPLDLTFDDEGRLYVAEEFGYRISTFVDDAYAGSFGQQGSAPGTYVRPNGVALMPDGTLLVADTWNYRIQQVQPDGTPILAWGQAGEFGFSAPVDPVDGFWGPRDVAVGPSGLIYVADTGNKRVRTYRIENGEALYQYDIGGGGSGPGELDEPAGLAVHPDDGRLYVADTWNRRVSVFTAEGVFLDSFTVRGWYEELGNRPYLAIDAERDLLYVTDPDGGRVLVYNTAGDCVGSFGSVAGDAPTSSQFRTLGGITVDDAGFVYVADAGLNRIVKYAPFEEFPNPAEMAPDEAIGAIGGDGADDQAVVPADDETIDESGAAETTPDPDPVE